MTINDFFALGLRRSSWLLHKMIDDLRPEEWTHRPCDGANTAAWIVSHLIAIENGALARLSGGTSPVPLPEPDFMTRYGMGSADLGHSYLDPATLVLLLDKQRDRLIEAVLKMPAEAFDGPVESPMFKNVGDAVATLAPHAGLHAGQISTIRRSLGKPATF